MVYGCVTTGHTFARVLLGETLVTNGPVPSGHLPNDVVGFTGHAKESTSLPNPLKKWTSSDARKMKDIDLVAYSNIILFYIEVLVVKGVLY